MGRSRGGLTSKLHLLAEGRGRALAKRITPGQAADTKELVALVDAVAVPRPGGVGRHRKKLDHLTADKAYGSRANRRWLRARGIRTRSRNARMCGPAASVRDRVAADPATSTPSGTRTVTRSSVPSTGSSGSGPWRPATTS